MINWAKYFDKIYCINFCQFTERKQLMQFQLNRVGILKSGIFEWYTTYQTNFNFYNYLKTKYPYIVHNVSLMFGHYNCVREALYNRYERILILEDDARFLKDLDLIEKILENKPEDADLILYDKIIENYVRAQQFENYNEYYYKFNNCWSAACYFLSRKGAERFAYLIEKLPTAVDSKFDNIKYHFKNLNCYCSKTNIAVQCTFQNCFSGDLAGKDFNWQKLYKYLQICFDNYMIRKDGSPYSYGDVIKTNFNNIIKITQHQNVNILNSINPTNINIFLACNVDQIYKLYPLLHSLTKFSKSNFNVYVMLNKSKIQQYYQLIQPFISNNLHINLLNNEKLKENDISFAKLLIPTLFPNLERILYLDINNIIIKEGIEWLYNIDFKNNYIAAYNLQLCILTDDNIINEYNNFKQITNCFFSNNIMLLNLKKIKQDGKDLEIINMFNNININDPLLSNDRTILNYIFKNKVLQISPIFYSWWRNLDKQMDFSIKRFNLINKWNFQNMIDFTQNIIITVLLMPNNIKLAKNNQFIWSKIFKKYNKIKQEAIEKINEYYME